ncbi:MAG TPA: hypothetical protein VMU66_06425, partial [Gaiellales bacterium]|nr:hypothetical protein [Gaiellales bacterium]
MGAESSSEFGRLRAALRLCFPAEPADALAAAGPGADPDPVRRLLPAVRRARLRFTADRWLAALPNGSSKPGPCPPLGPRRDLPALPALALALHLGLDLDSETLAQLFGQSPEQIGAALGRARRAVDPELPASCREFAAAVGRYRDPLEPLDGLPLLRHLGGCARCRAALEGARTVDDDLLAAIERAAAGLPDAAERRAPRALWLGPALGGAAVVLLVLVLVVAVLAGAHRLLPSHHPVPLVPAGVASNPLSGWLLETGQDGAVEAVDLATGARRVLIPGQPNNANVNLDVLISPDHRTIAVVASGPPVALSLWVYAVDGRLLHSWDPLLANSDSRVAGWLNADELLVTEAPAATSGETQQQYDARMAAGSQLVALEVRTGAQHVLLQGGVTAAFASPDGRSVAIDRIVANGSVALELRPLKGGQLGPPTATFGQGNYPLTWTPDSQRVVFAVPPSTPMTGDASIDALSLSGQVTTVARLPSSEPTNLGGSVQVSYTVAGITPDGARVVYGAGSPGVGGNVWSYWEAPLAGGPPRQLAAEGVGRPGFP